MIRVHVDQARSINSVAWANNKEISGGNRRFI